MPAREEVDAFVAELGQLMGIAGLALDESGTCTLAIDGGRLAVSVICSASDGALTLLATLPDIEPDGGLLLGLLEASYMGLDANGTTFAIEPGSGQIALQQRVDVAGDARRLAERLDAFATTALAWQDELSAGLPDLGEATGGALPLEPQGIRV